MHPRCGVVWSPPPPPQRALPQALAFCTVVKPAVEDMFLGYNGTIMCYGQVC